MIKAETVDHEGYEVPNWVNKCWGILTSGPSLGVIALGIALLAGLAVWNQERPAFSDVTKTQPSGSSELQVISGNNSLLPDAFNTLPALSANSPVGPAPLNSLQSLQSANSTQGRVGGLTQAAQQTTQAASPANQAIMRNLGL